VVVPDSAKAANCKRAIFNGSTAPGASAGLPRECDHLRRFFRREVESTATTADLVFVSQNIDTKIGGTQAVNGQVAVRRNEQADAPGVRGMQDRGAQRRSAFR